MDNVILHLSDWNSQDKYYELSRDLLEEFYNLVRQHGLDGKKPLNKDIAWHWFTSQVDHNSDSRLGPMAPDKPIRFGVVDMRLESFFLDWCNYDECLDEWEEQGL